MPTPLIERTKLLALADEKPLQALHASAGRLRRYQGAPESFLAVYVPSPISDEYGVILNASVHFDHRFAALRAIVYHHVEEHDRANVFVLKRGEADCAKCARLAPPTPQLTPAEQREHALRRRAY